MSNSEAADLVTGSLAYLFAAKSGFNRGGLIPIQVCALTKTVIDFTADELPRVSFLSSTAEPTKKGVDSSDGLHMVT